MFENVDEGHADQKENKEFHYFYNRQERLENAPQIVKDYYEGKNKPVHGIKIFFTKQNRYIFFGLIFFIAAIWIYSLMNNSRSYAKIDELDCEISAFSFEDQIYTSLSIKRNVKSKKTEPQQVKADFFLIDADKQIVAKESQSLIYSEGEQFLRLKNTDFEIVQVDAIVSAGDEEKEVSCKVKR